MGEHGQGTVVHIPATGRWRVAVTMTDGRRVWRTLKTRREAERVRRDLVQLRELEMDPTRQTLAEYLRSWLDGLASARNARVRPRTLDHYRLVCERHVIPSLGHLKLSAVTGRRIQAWVDADDASPQTVKHHHAVLRRALNTAVRQRLLVFNPAAHVELPEVEEFRGDPLTLAEARSLLASTAGDRLHALWRLAVSTGLRQAELLGLSWDDIGADAVTVGSQLQRIDGAWVRTPVKAARRMEAVHIDAGTSAALEAHRRRQASERTPAWRYWGLVFTTSTGEPYHGAEVLKAFKAACRAAGIRERRFHDLRGSSMTMLAELGVAEDVRQARAGHSTTDMARHYAKASDAQDRKAADLLGDALTG